MGGIVDNNISISTTIFNEELNTKEYNVQKYITGGTYNDFNKDTKKRELVQASENESLFVKGFLRYLPV